MTAHRDRGRQPRNARDHERPRLTEKGNGERLARRFGHELRHVVARGQWLAWDRRRWCRDANAPMVRAKHIAEELYREAADLAERAATEPDYSARAQTVLKWAASSSKASALRAMIMLAQSEEPIAATPDAFDRDAFAFNAALPGVSGRRALCSRRGPAVRSLRCSVG